MKNYILDQSLIGTGHLFPSEIRDQNWIGYHGTSTFYSSEIEEHGFSLAKPITDEEFRLLEELSTEYNIPYDAVHGFRELNSVSFFPLSELCLVYFRPNCLGGQGVGYVMDLINLIRSEPTLNHDSNDGRTLHSLINKINNIRSGNPVIYAVNLFEQGRIQSQIMTSAIHVYAPISPERLVGKMEISNFTDFIQINERSLKQKISKLFYDSEHYISSIQQ